MKTIKITCGTCHKKHEVSRTNEIPEHIGSMGCNWCPDCEYYAKDYYKEWYNNFTDDIGEYIPDNQLVIPFIIQEINENIEKKIHSEKNFN